jgi:uncharacterized protein (TIGR03086 family)
MPEPDLLTLYDRASAWTLTKVTGTAGGALDQPTPCDDWDVRTLMDHMLDTQRYFTAVARGEDTAPPSQTPPQLSGDDPAASFERGRHALLDAFGEPGVAERTGPALGIAFADQLLHGWDLAKATEQDATMPPGLADAAYRFIHARFTDDQRPGIFKPAVAAPPSATPQQELLAYTGRDPTV